MLELEGKSNVAFLAEEQAPTSLGKDDLGLQLQGYRPDKGQMKWQ